MSRHKFTVILDVDDESLLAHDEDKKPPPHDLSDWDFRDISAAINEGIVDDYESEVAWYDGEVDDSGEPIQ